MQVPDLWQNEALQHLRQGRDVVVHAPTGAGKTYIFELLIEAGFHKKAVFTVPTRALANDKLHEWRARNWNVGIATGDLAENLKAPVLVATLETQKAHFLKRKGPALFVIDEYQMLGDAVRGVSYELALALLPPTTQLLLLSGSVGNPDQVLEWLNRIGRNAVLVRHEQRAVPQEEVFLDTLSGKAPSRITGFWPRLVARALMADLGPILVFAPQRAAAEKLARHFAAAYPVDEPLVLSSEQRHLAGDKLSRMLRNRVAYHHSGLSYRQRAGLIEPLAKAGQLRIVAATTGLAAGINFSMRSVLVTDREYRHGFFHEEVRPDELLQMFGRAGRRGLDEVGYVLVAPERPRLGDARPITLQRSKLVDWPSLVGVMQGASERGELPFREAVITCERLFTRRPISLGVEHSLSVGARPCGFFVDAERARFARPGEVLILNSEQEWERKPPQQELPLRQVRVYRDAGWKRALEAPSFLTEFGEGNLCRLKKGRGKLYGREIPVAIRQENGHVQLVRGVRRKLRRRWETTGRREWFSRSMTEEVFRKQILPLIPLVNGGGEVFDVVERKELLSVRIDYSELIVSCLIDSHGVGLRNPPERKDYPEACRHCDQLRLCEGELSSRTSPAFAWRKLGLVDARGAPTRRGLIFSFFYHGEGLAIAAALEDEAYPIDDLVYDLGNLRAGHRFSDLEATRASRLGTACREGYPQEDFPGYLERGVPTDYGDGAAEVLRAMHYHPGGKTNVTSDSLRQGDIERVYVEWRSILRQVTYAPDVEWERWRELKAIAARVLEMHPAVDWAGGFPPLEPFQKRRCSHVLRPFR